MNDIGKPKSPFLKENDESGQIETFVVHDSLVSDNSSHLVSRL